jgi:deoxyribodipyrimidine photolyase-related protein
VSGAFTRALRERQSDPARRRWLFVPYDQLSDAVGPLSREEPRTLGIVLVEAPWKAARRPYHRQKLALVLANLRHFALEQAARGVAVRHLVSPGAYADALAPLARELGPLRVMRPAERELRVDLAPLIAGGAVEEIAHEGWLTTSAQFAASGGAAARTGRNGVPSQSGPPWRMDAFYRHVRRATGILMDGTRPAGGRWSFDAENRKPWRGDPPAPAPCTFTPDPITAEVGALIEARYASHPGAIDLAMLPATRDDAERAWAWARTACLPHFGPYEDAMSTASPGLFHTRVSPLLNIGRLQAARVVREAAALDSVPLASREGFVRQILGWREFVRHVHEATDGFRTVPVDVLGQGRPLPPAFWGAPSGLRCLDTVVADVWREGWSHHITRLMVLCNLATLLDLSPRELTDWFWVAYVDAFDWVVEPNVLGMGTYATGGLMTTKPYVSGAAYIDRMSDYCERCQFDPASTCPVTRLYWAFLARHEAQLRDNPRMAMPMRSLARRPAAARRQDAEAFARTRDALAAGRPLAPPTAEG